MRWVRMLPGVAWYHGRIYPCSNDVKRLPESGGKKEAKSMGVQERGV
jgi:hypothetical protein